VVRPPGNDGNARELNSLLRRARVTGERSSDLVRSRSFSSLSSFQVEGRLPEACVTCNWVDILHAVTYLIGGPQNRSDLRKLMVPSAGSVSGATLPGLRWNAILKAARSNAFGASRALEFITDSRNVTWW
jgi:hypothetical protein